jgi:uncharacterized Zn finger protein
MASLERCEDCLQGYHAPFARFERVAVREDGPSFLMRCRNCGTLWNEQLSGAATMPPETAKTVYPDFKP